MLTLKKVAVTGIPSSGKSSVCHFFDKLGAQVESADRIVHQLLESNSQVAQQVIALLGSDVSTENGLDRSLIAKKVFQHPELLKSLESILHPEVRREIAQRYQGASAAGDVSLFVVEIPLLFEAGMEKDFDATVTVLSKRHHCRERFAPGPEEFDRRQAQQWSQEQKAQAADYVLDNNGTLDELEQAVKDLYQELSKDTPPIEEPSTSNEPKE